MRANLRGYRSEDLGRVLQLWDRAGSFPAAAAGITVDQAVDLVGSGAAVTIVAEREGEIVGVVLGSATAAVGWLHLLALLPGTAEEDSVADGLVGELEVGLAQGGARRVSAAIREGDTARRHLERNDYRMAEGTLYLERHVPATLTVSTGLEELTGQFVNPRLWEELRGLEECKQVIERCVILPLAESELAARHAVRPPKAIVLFGPPGTGKTTFAKGIASRLGWPFVEINPGELAGEGPEGQASALGRAFSRILELPAAVVFVDEVEDLASIRDEERRISPNVTNEFLRQIPRFHSTEQHLLVCATNLVSGLDPAFLRPGRFDYVLPVGPPDAEARTAIWERYVREITDEDVDVGGLVEASDLFTPADIEFAARRAAQQAFERAHFEGVNHRATTAEFRAAIGRTRPTLSREMVERFEGDTRRFARQ